MRLGILTDVHESVADLRRALDVLKSEGSDRLILVGDVCRMCESLEETVAILAEEGVEGVWGNHDFGLCLKEPSADVLARHSGPLLTYMQGLKPRYEIDGCLFTHVEAWLNPECLEDLWWFKGIPDTPERLGQSFAAVPHRLLFVGHFHRWLLGTPAGLLPWEGEGPVRLDPESRYFVGVNAVCEGWCALYDTARGELTPFDLRDRR